TQTRKLLTNFSKNSFYLLPEPLSLGEFLTNYYSVNTYFYYKLMGGYRKMIRYLTL
ncbi:hypothetical protein GGR07_001595, partial [Bacteroides pyogenes]|nr:hypothetical protein [Bacteroides pyogenes]